MGIHGAYVKKLLLELLPDTFIDKGPEVEVPYEGVTARIDGVVRGCCAVEIESRTDKQVRGALLDLLFHPYEKKLLVLVPKYMYDPDRSVIHCQGILNALKNPEIRVSVVLLAGSGDMPRPDEDLVRLRAALEELGCLR